MGNCLVVEPQDKVSAEINSTLQRDGLQSKQAIKLLLLGAGECGKSTILKQMKILHKNGFTDDEKRAAIELVYRNTFQSILALIKACEDLDIAYESHETKYNADILKQTEILFPSPDIKHCIQQCWHDGGILKAFKRQNEFTLLDSAPYFLDNVDRTFSPGYLPTDQDILRTRLATVGVIETEFWIDRLQFLMYDVGGQRGERKKWIHCFEDVKAILFIASLSEYDQVLAEDRTRNRLAESLSLFEGIISLPWFKSTAIILFLNKNDLFHQKIITTDLGIYFSSYVGGLDYEEGLYFIKELFFSKNNNPKKTIYAHVTDATDTQHIRFVWKATKHIIMTFNLARAGLVQ